MRIILLPTVLVALALPHAPEGANVPMSAQAARAAECRRATGLIKLDGLLDESAWKNAHVINMFTSRGRAPKTKTSIRLMWDDDYLYFAAQMEDHDLYADIKQRNGMIWNNDVIELFIKPSEQNLRYYEFQSSPLNTPLELYFPSRGAGGYQRAAPITRLGLETATKLDGTLNNWEDDDRSWTAEWRIPWSAFKAAGGRPKPGDVWRFAACRYDYSKDFEQAELSSTSDPGFHTYESYAELRFVGPMK
jgi:hypothetical protein